MMMGLQLSIWTTDIESAGVISESFYVDDVNRIYEDDTNDLYTPGE